MTQLEAWIVTALGMGVVFVGLVLCIIAINVFNRAAKHVTWGEEGHTPAPAATPQPPAADAAPVPVPAAVTPAPSPEVLAAIATALEIERRLYRGRLGQRLTLNR